MNKSEAKNLIIKTFENPFDEGQFTYFIKNLLNNLDESKNFEYHGQFIPASYRESVKQYKRLGQYKDPNNNTIDVLVVNLKRESTLERARTLQRNFIAWYLKQKTREAALVAYCTDDYEDWRFSLVKMDFSLTQSKIEIELSPAKRYSFLVGVNEKSHTAQNQFVNLLLEKEVNPTLDNLEQAFNIETVTKEFFDEYRGLFIRIKQELDKIIENDAKLSSTKSQSEGIKTEFESKGVNSVDFSKKLLGQIIFLYFLQKKGWFGVGRDSEWGTGSKKFLRELLEKKHSEYKNFFNDILEPLFYEALRYDRQDFYYSRFNCKIPFLNGGLFDPIGNYDWVHTDITLPNELFSNNNKTKQDDTGDGIFDIFDRYNFTVIEDEPLEKEVAIDPELLGKAYEKFNAIRSDNFDEYVKALNSGKKGEENKFNKQFGVYYTPREIVHYMCRESLINYLVSEFSDKTDSYQKINTEQLDAFGNKERKGQLTLESEYKSNPYIHKEDIETLINYGELLGENETIVESKGKETDTYYYKLPESIRKNAELIDEKLADILVCDPAVGSGAFPVGMMHEIVSARNILSIFIKDNRRTIYKFKRECIEKSLYGVDIDNGAVEIAKLRLWLSLVVDEDDIANIKPLPNLDYKIVCGNSLIGVVKNIFNNTYFDQLEKIKPQYFNETNPPKKQDYKKQIDELILNITNGHNEFDFEVYFSEVFHKKGGFDIVIANPPYITIALGKKQKFFTADIVNFFKEKYKDVFEYKGNTYSLFFKKSISLLHKHSIITFITPNTLLLNSTFSKTRAFILKHCNIEFLLNITDKVFDEAEIGGNLITILSKFSNSNQVIQFKEIDDLKCFSLDFSYNIIKQETFRLNYDNKFNLDNASENLINKINLNTIPLGEVVKFYQGIITGDNKTFLSREKIDKRYYKILRGRDVSKYYYTYDNTYVLFDKNKLWSNTNEEYFHFKPKLINRQTGDSLIAAYDNESYFTLDSTHIQLPINKDYDLKYVLALFNSKLLNFLYNHNVREQGRIFAQVKTINLKSLPVKTISKSDQDHLIKVVDKILNIKRINLQKDTRFLEDQIDIMVYKLYNLTYEEAKIIDPEIEKIISKEEYNNSKIGE